MELLECVFKNTVTADSITTLDDCLYQTIYQPTNAILPPTSMVTDLFHPDNLRKLYPVDMEAITRAEDNFGRLRAICDAYIRHGLETVPPSERLESHPLYLKRLIDLTTHNDITRIAYDDIQRNMDELLQLVPELKQEVKMVKSLGEHLPTTLRDPPSAMRRIFQPDCMATYFMNS
ncbi:hypothetical protein, partial [Salmonella sp. s51944]|uniref:hypothetical protein n=1 Tax=Salmonella sp. s51944 TaxID=3159655 RepID=UPI003980B2E7